MVQVVLTGFVRGSIKAADGSFIESTTRLRSSPLWPNSIGSHIRVTASAINGEGLQYSFVGYDSRGSQVCNLYWNDSNATIDISSYKDDIAKVICCLKYVDNSTIYPEDIESAILESESFVSSAWYIDVSGNLMNEQFIALPEAYMAKPYPLALWRIDPRYNRGFPYTEIEVGQRVLGAFGNANDLRVASIAQSVKYIGLEAFKNTALQSVTIAPDCEYYETSFPADCEISR